MNRRSQSNQGQGRPLLPLMQDDSAQSELQSELQSEEPVAEQQNQVQQSFQPIAPSDHSWSTGPISAPETWSHLFHQDPKSPLFPLSSSDPTSYNLEQLFAIPSGGEATGYASAPSLAYTAPSANTFNEAPISPVPFRPNAPASDTASTGRRASSNRYRNAPPSVLTRRRAQNRASQRAYRERKEQRIRDLEQLLDEARQREDHLTIAYDALRQEYERLRSESEAGSGSDITPQDDLELLSQQSSSAAASQSSEAVAGLDYPNIDPCDLLFGQNAYPGPGSHQQ